MANAALTGGIIYYTYPGMLPPNHDLQRKAREKDWLGIESFLESNKDVLQTELECTTTDEHGNLPLHLAVRNGAKPDILKKLVNAYPPSLNMVNNAGNSAIMVAAKAGRVEALDALAMLDADLSIKNKLNENIIRVASKRVMHALEVHGVTEMCEIPIGFKSAQLLYAQLLYGYLSCSREGGEEGD
jgi:ankyrin repeat protein